MLPGGGLWLFADFVADHGEDWGLAAVELAAQYKEWEKGFL